MAAMIAKRDILVGWVIKETDPLGRRARVACSRCNATRLLAVEALQDGSAKGCGCAPAPETVRARRFTPPTFAHQVARAEGAFGPRAWRGSR